MIAINSDEDYYEYSGNAYLQYDAEDSTLSASTIEIGLPEFSSFSARPSKTIDKGIQTWYKKVY